MEKINLHTHSNFCHGKNSIEEMILSAIQKNFTVLGISSHSIRPFEDRWHIKIEEHLSYKDQILCLKEKYKNQIQIYFGFEADFLQNSVGPDIRFFKDLQPDYLIGSVHFLRNYDDYILVDDSPENVQKNVQTIFNNDVKSYVCEYFETQRKMLTSCNFQIWGHADLVKIWNSKINLFSEDESWYKEQIALTVKTAKNTDIVAEINTGGIARGYLQDVYPSSYMLEQLYQNKIPVCVSSDAHDTDNLDCAFEKAYALAKKIGYKELIYPVANKEYIVKL